MVGLVDGAKSVILRVLLCGIVTVFIEGQLTIVPLKEIRERYSSITYTKHNPGRYLDLAAVLFSPYSVSNFYMPESFILTIPQGIVQSPYGHIRIGDALIEELVWEFSPLKRSHADLNALAKVPCQKITGRVAVIAQEWAYNYYHWLCEILPRLMMLQEHSIDFDYLYIPELLRPFQRETLELFGIPQEKIIQASAQTCIQADEIIVPSYVARTFYSLPEVVEQLRKRLFSQCAQKIFNTPKIFISRRLCSYRRVINEDAVFKVFEEHGFVRYDLESLSFGEQIALFEQARIVVSPHGAGLTNILFCHPNTKLIELFQEHENLTYAYLAQILALNYVGIKTVDFQADGGYKDTIIPLQSAYDAIRYTLDV